MCMQNKNLEKIRIHEKQGEIVWMKKRGQTTLITEAISPKRVLLRNQEKKT